MKNEEQPPLRAPRNSYSEIYPNSPPSKVTVRQTEFY